MLTSVASTKGNASTRPVHLSAIDGRSLRKMEYLDLATVGPRLKERRPFAQLDLAVVVPCSNLFDSFREVPHGQRVWINQTILKFLPNSILLFPRFPVEIRRKIYGHALLRDETVYSKVYDNGTGLWTSKRYCEPNYGVLNCCADAHDYLYKEYGFDPLYKAGLTVFSPNVDQGVHLTIIGTAANAMLQIAPKFADNFNLSNIAFLVFEISGLDNDNAALWTRLNLGGMLNLKTLEIKSFNKISVPEQAEVSFGVYATLPKATSEITDTRSSGYTFHFFHETDDGRNTAEDFEAQGKICGLVVKQQEQQAILDFWMMLDRCVKNTQTFPVFPECVAMTFTWKH